AGGELTVAGLEWMGARAYDPSTRGFLSTDPLAAIPGAGWAANPYSYAGNDPLHALDPTGLRPATDADLQAYRDAHNGIGDEIGNWVSNNWEYLAGGAMVIGGGILMATGVGGPVGMALVSAGADTIIQKATTGQVNWGQVAVSGVAGGIGFGVGGALAKAGVTGVRAAVTTGAVEGATGGLGTYAVTTPSGQLTPGGALQAMTGGAVFGAAGGAAGFGLTRARGALGAAKPTPEPFMPPNTGGLSDDMAQTFSGGRYTPGTLPEDTILYRAGKPDAPLGQFFSRERPVGVTQTRIDKAIPEVWPDGNPAPLETGYAIKLPAGTPTYTGEVANQGGLYMGGTEQIVVQRPWEIPGVEVVDSWPLH
ncbi:MAG TPA: RHS repeat-associated core domain-containing protein, partial [Microlunatus sp.]